jgi:hypothetical protein
VWTMLPSLEPIVEVLRPAFTQPSFVSGCELLLAWILCLGRHTLRRVGSTRNPKHVPDHTRRHGLDTTYNFFERSAWTPTGLASRVAVLILTRLKVFGRITLLVDDTLAHKRGPSVWGLGWFRDAVASTRQRVATASGHNWVVVAVAVCLPFTNVPILAFPLLARLHRAGKGQTRGVALAREMLTEVLGWFPHRTFTLVGDGAYASKGLLTDLDERVAFVGRLRGDAAVYDPQVRRQAVGPEGHQGATTAQPESGGRQGRPEADGERGLGLAVPDRDRVRGAADLAGVRLRGGVADGAGVASDPGGGGSGPRGETPGRLSVHDRAASPAGVGGRTIRREVVH